MTEVLQEIVSLLTSGISQFATGLGQGLQTLVTSIFITTGEGGAQSLSTFGGVIIVFASISLAVGISRWIMNYITSLGN